MLSKIRTIVGLGVEVLSGPKIRMLTAQKLNVSKILMSDRIGRSPVNTMLDRRRKLVS